MRLILVHSSPRFCVHARAPAAAPVLLPAVVAPCLAIADSSVVHTAAELVRELEKLGERVQEMIMLHFACHVRADDAALLLAGTADAEGAATPFARPLLPGELRRMLEQSGLLAKNGASMCTRLLLVLDVPRGVGGGRLADALGGGTLCDALVLTPLQAGERDALAKSGFWPIFYGKLRAGSDVPTALRQAKLAAELAGEALRVAEKLVPNELQPTTAGAQAKQPQWKKLINAPRVWVDREDLTVLLKEARAKAGVEHVVVLKSGDGIPGGSGKSTLARKLASELQTVRTGPHIEVDFTLEDREQVRDLSVMQREVLSAVYPDRIDSYTKITPDELNQQYRALFSVAKNGILLLDNVSPEQNNLQKMMPPSESGWLTIVTTRESLQDLDAYNPMKLEIGEFSVGEGSKLLEKYAFENSHRAKSQSDEQWIEKLVEVCGGIALAIELAGSLLRTQPKLTMEKLHQKLAVKGAHKLADKEKSMSACLKVTYDALSGQEQRALWQACAFPKSFKRELFEHAFALWPKSDDDTNDNNAKDDDDDDDDESSDLFSDDDDLAAVMDDPLDKLKERSMLQFDAGRERFGVHDVVRSFVASRKRDSDDGSAAACRQRCGLAYADFVESVEILYEEKGSYRKALEQAREEAESLEAVMMAATGDCDRAVLKSICDVFGNCVSNFVGFGVQQVVFETGWSMFNHDEIATGLLCKYWLAGVLNSKGDCDSAEAMYRDVMEVEKRVWSKQDRRFLMTKASLAGVLLGKSEYSEAEIMYREVVEVLEHALDKDHPSILACKGNLAAALVSQGKGRYGAAETIYREILEVDERVFGKEHPRTLGSKQNWAFILKCRGKYLKAESTYRDVIQVQEQALGQEHTDTLTSKHNLAGVLYSKRDYKKAETMYREVLQVRQRVLGEAHRHTLVTEQNLGSTLICLQKSQEAQQLLEHAVSARTKVLGDQHPEVLAARKQLQIAREQAKKAAKSKARKNRRRR